MFSLPILCFVLLFDWLHSGRVSIFTSICFASSICLENFQANRVLTKIYQSSFELGRINIWMGEFCLLQFDKFGRYWDNVPHQFELHVFRQSHRSISPQIPDIRHQIGSSAISGQKWSLKWARQAGNILTLIAVIWDPSTTPTPHPTHICFIQFTEILLQGVIEIAWDVFVSGICTLIYTPFFPFLPLFHYTPHKCTSDRF